jgi:hypothetical protein
MSAKSDYLENAILDHVLGTSALSSPTVYISLYTSDPGETDSGTEVAGNGYARLTASFGAAASGSASGPTVATEFTAAGGAWGSITHFGIHDAVTSGNLLYYGALTAAKTIADGDTLRFAANSITITEA